MWLLLEGWLLRNVLMLLGWLAAAAAVAAVLFGARQAGRNAERVQNMRHTRLLHERRFFDRQDNPYALA